MSFSFTSNVLKDLKRIKKKQPRLFSKIQKKLSLFKENSNSPSLRNHKLKGKLSDSWSISIESDLRMLYYIKDKKAIFFLLGTHDEVYRE